MPVFFALASVPFFFGLSLWLTLSGIEPSSGALEGPAYDAVLWIAGGFSIVAVIVVSCQTWLARSRLREFLSESFGRILPVMVVPETSLTFALVLCFLALGLVPDSLTNPPILSATAASQIAAVFQVYALACLSNFPGIGLSLRVRDISTAQAFLRMLRAAEMANLLPVIALVWAFLQLGAL